MRLVNLFVAVLFLCALVPAHSVSAAPSQAVLAAPSLTAPANGLLPVADGLRPTFKWKAVTGALSYEIQIATTSAFSNIVYPAVGTTHNVGNVIEFQVDQDMPANSRLYWRMRTINGDGAGKWSGARYFYTRPLPVPPDGFVNGPMSNLPGTLGTLRPVLEWDKSENVVKYTLQISTSDTFSPLKLNKTITFAATVDPLVYEHTTDLAQGTQYFWRVMAIGSYGGAKSDWSATQSFTTPTLPPKVPVPTAPLNKTVNTYSPQITWNAVTPDPGRTIEYQLQLSTSSKFTSIYAEYSGIAATSFTIPVELPAGTYYWRLRAVDDRAVVSNWSKVYNFKTPATVVINVLDAALYSVGTIEGIEGITVTYVGLPGTLTTNADGSVTIKSAPTGSRSIRLAGTDFLNFSKTQSIAAGRLYEFTYQIKRRPMRIDLTWGKLPSDLDVHLWTPEGTPEIHIYPDRRGSITASPWARVEKDALGLATTKTERITIQNRFPGTYVFAVRQFSPDGKWETSNAQIVVSKVDATGKVWQKYAPINVVKPGGTYQGMWWYVFDLDGGIGEISLITNTVQIESPGPYDKLGGTALESK